MIRTACIFLSILCISLGGYGQTSAKPNIVIIITDDHSFQTIGAYGSPYGATPNIDRLAREGMIFNKAFVANSICAPSRAILLTGKYSHKNGMRDNRDRFDISQDIFPKRLQQGGYSTAWIGKWHLVTYPQGFDYWNILPGQGQYYNPSLIGMQGDTTRVEGYATDVITDLTINWLDKQDPDKPFCVIVGEKAPHRTWMPDTGDLGKFDHIKFPLPKTFFDQYENRVAAAMQDLSIEKTMLIGYDLKMKSSENNMAANFLARMSPAQRRKWDAYYSQVEADFLKQNLSGRELTKWKFQRYMKDYYSTVLSLDRNIGKILDYLDKSGLSKNTMVVYTSDQGFYMGEHGWFDKRFMYEESMRTPLIVKYPPLVKAGSASNSIVSNVDFAPTFLDLAGMPSYPSIQGRSLLPILQEPGTLIRNSAYYHYYEYPGEHSVMKHFGIRTERYKLIRFYGHKNFWELYDLKKDPSEMKNLYGQKKYEALISELRQMLREVAIEYDDQEAVFELDRSLNDK